MADTQLLANTEHIALSPSTVLATRLGLKPFVPLQPPDTAGNTSLPVLPAGPNPSMTPGQTYPSAGDANQLLYLPSYQVTQVVVTPNDGGAGGTVKATLTTAAAPAPQAGKTIAVVPHVLRAQLVYTLTNEQGHPTVAVRKDFDPVSTPGAPMTLTVADAGDLGQVALALGTQKATWASTLVLTADMAVAVPAPRLILVDTAALNLAMRIDPTRLATPNPAKDLAASPASTTTPPASTSTSTSTPGKTPDLGLRNMLQMRAPPGPSPGGVPRALVPPPVAPPQVERPAPVLMHPVPVVAQPSPILVHPVPVVAQPSPGVLHFPILHPLPPPHPGPGPVLPRLVTTSGQTVQSLGLATVPVDVPIDKVTLPPATTLKRVPCDGVDLWVDQTVGHDFYYLPQVFRLSFASTASGFVPTLWVTFDGGGSDPSTVSTQLTMQLLPYTDPRDVGRARAAAAQYMASVGTAGVPTMMVQEPPITQLEWWIPSASGADQSQVSPAPATSPASFEQGLSAQVAVDYPQFQRIVDRLQVAWAAGLEGAVMYSSPENPALVQSLPIAVNFHAFEADALTVSLAPAGGDAVALTLTNGLACDVRVDAVTMFSGSSSAVLAVPDAATGQVIPAGGTVAFTATGTHGATPAPADLDFVWQAVPTPAQLLALCAEVIGTTLVTPEAVPLGLETLPGFFRSGVGPRQLTKLGVEFTDSDPSVQAQLTPGALTATVNLTPNLLLSLLDDPASRRFTYKVTNFYDDSTTVVGPALTWDGGSPLVVEANPPEGQAHAAT